MPLNWVKLVPSHTTENSALLPYAAVFTWMPVPLTPAVSARPTFAKAAFNPLMTSLCESVGFTAYVICVDPTATAIDDAEPVGQVPFIPTEVAWLASCVTLTS